MVISATTEASYIRKVMSMTYDYEQQARSKLERYYEEAESYRALRYAKSKKPSFKGFIGSLSKLQRLKPLSPP